MPQIEIVVREAGRLKPDHSLTFDVPEIPRIGDYISIRGLDTREPLGGDVIVRHVWWRLNHSGNVGDNGAVTEIFVECDQAIGPYSTPQWRKSLELKRKDGLEVPEFEVDRMPVPKILEDGETS